MGSEVNELKGRGFFLFPRVARQKKVGQTDKMGHVIFLMRGKTSYSTDSMKRHVRLPGSSKITLTYMMYGPRCSPR